MALADFDPSRSAFFVSAPSIASAIKSWIGARRAAHERHLALQSLLFLPQHRLNDLGIRQDELVRAMEIHRK